MDRDPVDPAADRPVVKQVADRLRRQIRDGVLQPGQSLPGEYQLTERYDVGRGTIREALTLLRGEGLIETIPRVGTRVRAERPRTELPAGPGTEVTARMPTEAERAQHQVPQGVPVLVLRHADGTRQVVPADRFAVMLGDDG
ncbi:GntR family transcriptional regulator [Actinomadura sp. LOL_016]|uniref:GntR family transcriptional regulator n=1 Tax=unclassified Actinomadura TaxID=2626254 RepID=UPI003A80AE79